jgi:hypothetical protein
VTTNSRRVAAHPAVSESHRRLANTWPPRKRADSWRSTIRRGTSDFSARNSPHRNSLLDNAFSLSHQACVGLLDLVSITTTGRYVSRSVRPVLPSASINLHRKWSLISHQADHHCAPLQLLYSRYTLADLQRLFEARVALGAADLEILRLSCRVRSSDLSDYPNDIASAGAESDCDLDQSYVIHGPHGGDFELPF